MDGHDYHNKASFEGKEVYYYNLPEDFLPKFVRTRGYADSREATIYFKGAKSERVTIYGSRMFESGNPDLVLGDIERIVLTGGKPSPAPKTEKGPGPEKKSLWQRLFGR